MSVEELRPESNRDKASDYVKMDVWLHVKHEPSVYQLYATQSLLYAVGLGKGMEGIRDFSGKCELVGMKSLTPAFPSSFCPDWELDAGQQGGSDAALYFSIKSICHSRALFIPLAVYNDICLLSETGGATRNCFYAGFAAQRNFAETTLPKGSEAGSRGPFGVIQCSSGNGYCTQLGDLSVDIVLVEDSAFMKGNWIATIFRSGSNPWWYMSVEESLAGKYCDKA
ncbi:protein root UVB sensitive 1, chloroplastic [Tanacetum coccineum]